MASSLAIVIIVLVCVLVAWMLTFSILYKFTDNDTYRDLSLILPLKDKLFGKSYFSRGYNNNSLFKVRGGGDFDSLEDDDYLSYATSNYHSNSADVDDDVF